MKLRKLKLGGVDRNGVLSRFYDDFSMLDCDHVFNCFIIIAM